MNSADITSPAPMSPVGTTFTVRGTAAAGCTGVTVVVTSSSGTQNYDAPVTGGEFNVTVTAGVGGASVSAYCTASGPNTASTVSGLTVSDS